MGFVNLFKKFEDRPRIKIEPTALDKIIDALSLVLLVLMLVTVFQNYAQLPDKIPTHFDADGVANDFGSKLTILILPAIGFITFTGMFILNKFPHKFNYLVKITAENAKQQYTIGTRIIRFTNLFIMAIFYYISYKTVTIALQETEPVLNKWFTPVILSLMGIGLVAMFITSVLQNKKSK